MQKNFIDFDDSKCYFEEYKDDKIEDLVMKINDGYNYVPSPKEELYLRINDAIVKLAKIYEKEYHSIENDWGEFYFAIVIATEKAICWYDREKGNFQHFWRKIVKYEKIRLLRSRKAFKRIQTSNVVFVGQCQDSLADLMLYRFGEKDNYTSFIKELYVDELLEKVLDFIQKTYGERDYKMLLLWLNYFSLNEIAENLQVTKKYILSRLYTIINAIRRNLDCNEYV
ncbi:MAG: hypothetical protein WCR63_02040 [Bacilli bacterium]